MQMEQDLWVVKTNIKVGSMGKGWQGTRVMYLCVSCFCCDEYVRGWIHEKSPIAFSGNRNQALEEEWDA